MSIRLEDLEVRGIYRLRARNLTMGVWTGESWIGIRDKFGLRLDQCEIPGDDVKKGTAVATEHIGTLPGKIELRCTGDTVCQRCRARVEFVPDDPDKPVPGTWVHKNYNVKCETVRPVGPGNTALMDYLTDLGGVP